jgi:phosphoglycolate phosphatase-like HAD superfamily hydrolase
MHLVWDWNGTLLDDLHAVIDATNDVFDHFPDHNFLGGDRLTVELYPTLYTRPIWTFYGRLLGRQVTREEFEAFDVVFHAAYRRRAARCELTADAAEALAAWRGQGSGQSLLSMSFHDELVPLVEQHGVGEYFLRVDGLRQSFGGDCKADHLRLHLEQLGLVDQPDQVVLVGDTLDDAAAAKAVGASCVLYASGTHTLSALLEPGFPVAQSLAEAVTLAAR